MNEFGFGILVIVLIFGITYITKLRRDNRTKDLTIDYLKRIIKILQGSDDETG